MIVLVSFVMVRLSQKSARSGAKYRNIVEIVVALKIRLVTRPYRIIVPGGLVKALRQTHPRRYTA
jgi:hypothetical protein